jgi:hypothetical protein
MRPARWKSLGSPADAAADSCASESSRSNCRRSPPGFALSAAAAARESDGRHKKKSSSVALDYDPSGAVIDVGGGGREAKWEYANE